jgi:hypothetical protein
MWDVEQVRAVVARSTRRGRVAIVIADNRKRSHSRWFPPGTWLARPSLKEQLYLAHTPAYDPDANRHSPGGARISRRMVTYNHQRKDFDLLLS